MSLCVKLDRGMKILANNIYTLCQNPSQNVQYILSHCRPRHNTSKHKSHQRCSYTSSNKGCGLMSGHVSELLHGVSSMASSIGSQVLNKIQKKNYRKICSLTQMYCCHMTIICKYQYMIKNLTLNCVNQQILRFFQGV